MYTLSAESPGRMPSHATVVPPTVFVVDDDISVRESIESLIRHEGFNVKSFASASAFLEHPPSRGPGCLILDIGLPGLTGLELQRAIASDRPSMPIVFVTGREDARTVVQAMKAGALEFITKPFSDNLLLDAVRAAVERSKDLWRCENRKTHIKRRYEELTRREREVMSQVMEGFLNREIGERLGISEITVKAHRGQVMRKMEAESLAQLIHMAVDAGI